LTAPAGVLWRNAPLQLPAGLSQCFMQLGAQNSSHSLHLTLRDSNCLSMGCTYSRVLLASDHMTTIATVSTVCDVRQATPRTTGSYVDFSGKPRKTMVAIARNKTLPQVATRLNARLMIILTKAIAKTCLGEKLTVLPKWKLDPTKAQLGTLVHCWESSNRIPNLNICRVLRGPADRPE
jgi:hypothetical protein